jgi:hypothetical protein
VPNRADCPQVDYRTTVFVYRPIAFPFWNAFAEAICGLAGFFLQFVKRCIARLPSLPQECD